MALAATEEGPGQDAQRDRVRLDYLSYAIVPSRTANSIQVMRMCDAFADLGYEVALRCRRLAWKPRDPFAAYGVAARFSLRSLYLPRVPLLSRALYTAWVWLGLRAPGGARRVLYGRDPFALAALARSRRDRSLLVFEAHQPPPDRVERACLRALFRSQRFARLVVISHALRERYLAEFPELAPERVLVAPDAAAADAAQAVPPPETGGALRVGYAGSLSEGKGVGWILELAEALPELCFEIVGGSPDEVGAWQARARGGNVRFAGHVEPSRMPSVLAGFDLVLAPYQPAVPVGAKQVDVARWMSPLKLFEYMAAERAIVASDLPVLREVLRHGENAWLAPPGDLDAWVRALRELASRPDERRRLARRAREDALRAFTWRRRAERVVAGLVPA